MKGFLAVCLAEVPNFLAAKLTAPIHLALSCDEEVGCRGVRPLVAHIRDHLPKPGAVIVGEPTSMKVVNGHKSALTFATEVTGLEGNGHKSALTFATEVTGLEGHSALTDRGVNAIMVAGLVMVGSIITNKAPVSLLSTTSIAFGSVTVGQTSTAQTVTITITGTNDAPVGVNDAGAVAEDATLAVAAGSGVLVNDTDPDATTNPGAPGSTVNAASVQIVADSLRATAGTPTLPTLTVNANGTITVVQIGRAHV